MTTLNGKIYVMGGGFDVWDSDGSRIWLNYNEILEYDPVSDNWNSIGTLSHGMENATACSIEDRIYLFQGRSIVAGNILFYGLESYDPGTDTWETLSNYPEMLSISSICVMDGMIYVSGGTPDMDTVSNITYKYNPLNDTWTRLADMNHARAFHVMEAVNGKIYVIGGLSEFFNSGIGVYQPDGMREAEMYDPATDTWTAIENLPWDISKTESFSKGKYICMLGGVHNIPSFGTDYIIRYDTENDSYEFGKLGTLPYRRMIHGVVATDDWAYVAGGYNNDGGDTSGTATLWRWDLNFIHLKKYIPDQHLEDGSVSIELSEHFEKITEDPIEYTACVADESVVSASINGSTLELEKKSAGTTEVHILAKSGENENGCAFTVGTTVGFQEEPSSCMEPFVFPNPATGLLTIETEHPGKHTIEITSLNGQLIYSTKMEEPTFQLDLSSFQKGIYFITVRSRDQVWTEKIIKL
jgi:N-acetylneuraminic acid mutarotase